jgi:hypothetical protein
MKNFMSDAWLQLSGAGVLILAAVMFIAPFVISIIANIGRPVPRAAPRYAKPRRLMAPPRRVVS